MLATTREAAAQADFGRARGCRFLRQAMVPLRDGTRLATSIFLPEQEGRYPVVMKRLPYNRLLHLDDGERWARSGYAYVVQDVRGRYDSEGEFDPFTQEEQDTPDAIAWLLDQPWCDGRVGTMGPSYLLWVQTLGIARGDGPTPAAIVPTFAPSGAWRRGWYAGGPLSLFLAFWWMCFDVGSRTDNNAAIRVFDLDELLRRLPLETLDVSSGAGEIGLWRETMAHPLLDEYWEKFDVTPGFDRFTMPSLHIAGWYDYYVGDMLEDWAGICAAAPSQPHRLLIGPWGHNHGLSRAEVDRCAVDFGPNGVFDEFALYHAWFERVFHDRPPEDGLGQRPIRLFVMGRNEWRDEDEWPLARTEYADFFLHSGGRANTLHGDGVLDRRPPGDEPADRYDYDPADPVPTRGGNHSIGPRNDAYRDLIWCGPSDQRPNEERADVLVYTTEPLAADIEATGPVTVQLWAASSAPDTDWVARLVDVHPDGLAVNITEGVVRARFRNDPSRPQLVEPGTAVEYRIELQPTSNVFFAGHRIRLEVTSSNFPLWDRNLNTGDDPNRSSDLAVARQQVLHDAARPSRLVLPLIA